jgi:hypothetical protein
MQRKIVLPLTALLLLGVAACNQQPAATAAAPAAAPAEDLYRPVATIQDIMDTEVDPNADFIWASTGFVYSRKGLEDKSPKNDEDWLKLRHAALVMIEASNLLVVPGRRVADEGKALDEEEKGGIEDPKIIQQHIEMNRAAFVGFAHRLHDVGSAMLKAIDAKDVAALDAQGEPLDAACEQCHRTFWYPNAVEPIQTLEPPPGFTGLPPKE